MTPKIRMMSVTDAQKRVLSAAVWRLLSGLINGCNGGWASGTE